ncbi:hypothetical protein H4S06_005624, partial [Coemansia sp. BCRC 34490]
HTATRRLEAERKCGRGEGVRGPAEVRPGARPGEHGPRGENVESGRTDVQFSSLGFLLSGWRAGFHSALAHGAQQQSQPVLQPDIGICA